jgi:hypothetical protein
MRFTDPENRWPPAFLGHAETSPSWAVNRLVITKSDSPHRKIALYVQDFISNTDRVGVVGDDTPPRHDPHRKVSAT